MALRNSVDFVHEFNINVDTREVYLYDEVSSQIAMSFIKNIHFLERSPEPIIVHQLNSGGEWEPGMAMYDVLSMCPCFIIFISHGCASSMGSVIPQSVYGKGLRLSMPNCSWLIHEGALTFENTYKATISNVEFYKKTNLKMYNIYANVCQSGPAFQGQTQKKIKNYLNEKLNLKEDWILSANEALDHGFIDGIFGAPGFENIKEIKKWKHIQS